MYICTAIGHLPPTFPRLLQGYSSTFFVFCTDSTLSSDVTNYVYVYSSSSRASNGAFTSLVKLWLCDQEISVSVTGVIGGDSKRIECVSEPIVTTRVGPAAITWHWAIGNRHPYPIQLSLFHICIDLLLRLHLTFKVGQAIRLRYAL